MTTRAPYARILAQFDTLVVNSLVPVAHPYASVKSSDRAQLAAVALVGLYTLVAVRHFFSHLYHPPCTESRTRSPSSRFGTSCVGPPSSVVVRPRGSSNRVNGTWNPSGPMHATRALAAPTRPLRSWHIRTLSRSISARCRPVIAASRPRSVRSPFYEWFLQSFSRTWSRRLGAHPACILYLCSSRVISISCLVC